VVKKVRDKQPVLDILVRTPGCHWKLSWRWKAYQVGVGKVNTFKADFILSRQPFVPTTSNL